MAVFDQYIISINNYIEELNGKGRQVREFENLISSDFFTPANAGAKSGVNIVLRSDTFLELGNPVSGSCSIFLYSDNPALLQDGRITLIGPDVNESPSGQIPFGQVIIVGGENLNDDDYYLLNYLKLSDRIEGYMINSTPENIWSRISREAAERGFNFGILGSTILRNLKAEQPKIQSAEVLFITSSREDVIDLHKIGEPVRDLAGSIKGKIWKDKGVDISDCIPGVHCGACSDKTVCDEIKKMGAEHQRNI